MRTFRLKAFVSALIAAFVLAEAVPAWALDAQTFSHPQVSKAYGMARARVNGKVAAVRNITDADRKKIAAAEAPVIESFKRLNFVFSSKTATKAAKNAAILDLARKYASLSKTIAAIVATKTVAVRGVPVRRDPIASTGTISAPADASGASGGADAGAMSDVLYYADSFEGGGTANGDTFVQSAYSAARCSVSLGKLLQITAEGKSVVVKANDRPNCTKHPNIADLTTTAFKTLAPLSRGKLAGRVKELGWTPQGYAKKTYAPDAFRHLGIRLEEGIPNTYLPGETLVVEGSVTDGKTDSVLFLRTPSGKKRSLSYSVGSDGRFAYEYPLSETGEYELVVASGMGFSTDRVEKLHVLSETALEGAVRIAEAPGAPAWAPSFVRRESSDLSPVNLLDLSGFGANVLKTVEISQAGGKTIVKRSMGDIAVLPEEAAGLDPLKPVHVAVTVARSSTSFSMDAYSRETGVFSGELPLAPSYQVERKEPVSHLVSGNKLRITAAPVTGRTQMRPDVYLILPTGGVETHRFPTGATDSAGYLTAGKAWTLEIPLSIPGQHIVEIMYANGFAAYSAPVAYGTAVAAILPNEYDVVSKEAAKSDAASIAAASFKYVNALRTKVGLSDLSPDAGLTKLAQFKAEDMATFNYVGHNDSAKQKITGTAKRAGVDVAGGIGENVAGGSVSFDFLIAGLALSGGHRANMLGTWTKMGVGAVEKDGLTYYVQIFGE